MPTYEYRCPNCGNQFEKFQRMTEKPVAECPQCGAAAERRLSGGAGFLFKGSGFYITDYRGESYKKAAESEKGGGEAAGTEKKAAEPKPSTGAGAESGTGAKSE